MAHSFKTAMRMLGASGCRGAGLNRARFGAADLVDLRSEIRVGDRSARRPARSKHFGSRCFSVTASNACYVAIIRGGTRNAS
jgi:hypothetical protein